ncbi:MAG: rhodanese-like domain-containing protein [Rhodospirillaceae bacterium]
MSGQFIGDVSPQQSRQGLIEDPRSVMIDVRTAAEWAYVGGPDLSDIGRRLLRIEWQSFPSGQRNPNFVEEVTGNGIPVETPVYLICRSGIRSRAAAQLLAECGYTTYNVSDGFEGPLDAAGHRGALGGWKAEGLPWKQG